MKVIENMLQDILERQVKQFLSQGSSNSDSKFIAKQNLEQLLNAPATLKESVSKPPVKQNKVRWAFSKRKKLANMQVHQTIRIERPPTLSYKSFYGRWVKVCYEAKKNFNPNGQWRVSQASNKNAILIVRDK